MGKINRILLLVVMIVFFGAFFFELLHFPESSPPERYANPEEREVESNQSEPKRDSTDVPQESMHSWIGASSQHVRKQMGKPDRVDPSAYGYDWWTYEEDETYKLVGIEDGRVVTLFALGKKLDTTPFKIGGKFHKVLEGVSLESTYALNANGNAYQFELSEKELNVRPLVKVGDVWAILYFDQFTKKLGGIRYLDADTLIRLRPYTMSYRGKLAEPEELTREEWKPVETGEERHIFQMTNVIRGRFDLNPLKWHEKTAKVAFQHSKEMAEENYFSHYSKDSGNLGERLHAGDVTFLRAGENIASQYTDGISAVFGWMNSEGHRENMLQEDFTYLGAGVYENYYTQNFITLFRE